MGRRFENKEKIMICHNCGGRLDKRITNLPFKISDNSIVIIKELPVLQCVNCNEYLIEDAVMEKVDAILNKIDRTTELEVLSYAV
jgi:YgiT-type zinc finger domain-containing protein